MIWGKGNRRLLDLAGYLHALLPALLLLSWVGRLPLMEDGLFWWVPGALGLAESGWSWLPPTDLPLACLPDLPLPPQWQAGLPDYGHPPLWFAWLATWIRLFGPQAWVIHLADLPVVLAMGLGFLTLGRRLGHGSAGALASLPILLSPPLLSQVFRPDTDLPLLALVPWAMCAIWDRRPLRFAVIALLATWCKEPGVLLVVPALIAAIDDRRFLAAAAVPPLGLLVWALIHYNHAGWGLAGSERLAAGFPGFLSDFLSVVSFAFWEQGRWLGPVLLTMLALSVALARKPLSIAPSTRRSWLAILSFVGAQALFYGAFNFLGGRGGADTYTHVRYLLPLIGVGGLLVTSLATQVARRLASSWSRRDLVVSVLVPTILFLAQVPFLNRSHAFGPEASLNGMNLGRAWIRAVPMLERLPPGTILVESYLFTALTRPYAGLVVDPMPGILPYGPQISPDAIAPGTLLVHASYGEPLSRLGELNLKELDRVVQGDAWVAVSEVLPGRRAVAPRNSPVGPPERPH